MSFLPVFHSYFRRNCFAVYSNFGTDTHTYIYTHICVQICVIRRVHGKLRKSLLLWLLRFSKGFCGWVRAETIHTHTHPCTHARTLRCLRPGLNGLNAFYGPVTFFNCRRQLNWATKLNKKCCSCCMLTDQRELTATRRQLPHVSVSLCCLQKKKTKKKKIDGAKKQLHNMGTCFE